MEWGKSEIFLKSCVPGHAGALWLLLHEKWHHGAFYCNFRLKNDNLSSHRRHPPTPQNNIKMKNTFMEQQHKFTKTLSLFKFLLNTYTQ